MTQNYLNKHIEVNKDYRRESTLHLLSYIGRSYYFDTNFDDYRNINSNIYLISKNLATSKTFIVMFSDHKRKIPST